MTRFVELHDLKDGAKTSINIDRIDCFFDNTGYKSYDFDNEVPCTTFVLGGDFTIDVEESYDDIVALMQRI